jgi:hypothetical protein
MGATADLFGPRHRASRRVLMHIVDAGEFPDGKRAGSFLCRRCQHATGWIYATLAELRRGMACPKCNEGLS